MENNKLQELTRKLYNDGLEKGRAEADALVAEARQQAAAIVAEAKAAAEAEIKAAQTRSKDIEKNTLTEIALAGRQAVAKIKTEIADAVIMKSTGKAVAGAASDPAFVKEMLLAVAKNWTSNTSDVSLSALLPAARITATACPLFVPLVENGYFDAGNVVTRLVARDYLREIKAAGVDTLILGCTHYPLVAPILGELMGPEVTLIDPGRETARDMRAALADAGLLRDGAHGEARYFVSDSTESFARLSDWFLGEYAGGPVTRISVDGYPVE